MDLLSVPKRLVEVSLHNVAALSPGALIEEGEQKYAQRLQRAARAVQASGAHIIMLTGPSASGKTTTAHKLAQTLTKGGTPAQVISLDNFFLGVEKYPTLPDGTKDYESPDTLNMAEINRCLAQLDATGQADVPVYDFVRERPADHREHIDLQGGVCIMEGTHALNPELTRLLPDEGVFRIYAGLREEYAVDGVRTINTRDIRLCRRLLRDMVSRGHSPEKTLAMWGRVLDGENQHIKVYKRLAQLTMDTSFSYELGVIAGLVGQALAQTDPACPQYALLDETAARFARVTPLAAAAVPKSSMLQEFYALPAPAAQ